MFKRYYHNDAIYFVTTNTQDRYPYFEDYGACQILLENVKLAKKLLNFKLYAFIIMSDHFHVVIFPGSGKHNISQIMHFIKKHSSYEINMQSRPLGKSGPSVKTVREPFLQEAVGILAEHRQRVEAIQVNIDEPFKWQHQFYDRIIRNDSEFNNVIDYINIKNAYELAEKYHLEIDEFGIVDYHFYSHTNRDMIDE